MTDPDQRKKRKRRGRYVSAFVLVLLLLDVIWVQWDRRITIGPDTTRITAPIVDGYPDYLAAMNVQHSRGVTPENNAAPPIMALLDLQAAPQAWCRAVYAQWSIPEPGGGAKTLFQTFPAWIKEHGQMPPATGGSDLWPDPFEDEADNAVRAPWSAADHVRLAQWLQDMTPALAALDDACRRPKFYIPLALEDGRMSAPAEPAILPGLYYTGPLRTLSRAVVARAMLRLHDGDLAGFRQDVLLCMRLARLLVQQPTLIEHLVTLAIDEDALQAVQRAAAESLDPATAETLRREIEALPPPPSPAHAIDEAERYVDLGGTFMFRQATGKYGIFNLLPVNYDAALRRVNHLFDRTVQTYSLPTEPQRRDAMQRLAAEVDAQFSNAGALHRLTHMEELFLAMTFPSLTKVGSLQTCNLVDRDLALTAFALRQARARDGAFPNTLADLNIPGFTPPPDRFLEKPLVYRRKADGYILYSVGPDLEDNAGTPRPNTGNGKKWDLVVTADH